MAWPWERQKVRVDDRFSSAPLNVPGPEYQAGAILDPWLVGLPDPWTTSKAAANSPRFSLPAGSAQAAATAAKGTATGVAPQVPGRLFAGGIGKFLKGPGGAVLAGLPIALGAIEQLNNPGGDTIGNLSGAVGAVGGGVGGAIGGAALGAATGPLAPIMMPLGAWAGSALGGATGRGVSDLVRNMDPLGKQIKQNERLADSQFYTQLRHAEAALPLQQLQAEISRRQTSKQMMDNLQAHALMNYQNAMLQAPYATATPVDMSPFAAIAQSAMRA